jgi:hypothetical protein
VARTDGIDHLRAQPIALVAWHQMNGSVDAIIEGGTSGTKSIVAVY